MLFLLSLFASSLAIEADDYPYLTFMKAYGSTVDLSVSNLVLTISSGQLIASDGSSSSILTLSDLSKMYFSTSKTTSITDVSKSENDEGVEAFTLSGMYIDTYSDMETAKENLQKGVFIMRSSTKTYKIEVK